MRNKSILIGLFMLNLLQFGIHIGRNQEIQILQQKIVKMDNGKASLYQEPVCILSMNQSREEYFQFAMACWIAYTKEE